MEAVLEVGGELKLVEHSEPAAGKTSDVKMSVMANLAYHEKTLQPGGGDPPARSIRHYERAEAVIKVGSDGVKPQLRQERRLIATEIGSGRVTLFSPHGPLTREELDLVDVLANSLLVDRLLPSQPLAVGASWRVEENVVAALCGIDSIRSSALEGVLKEADAEAMKMDIAGRVEGTISGLSTKIELKAKCRFDRKLQRITWLGLLVQENRAAGPMGPGLDVVAKLQVKIVPQQRCESLGDKALTGLAIQPSAELERLNYQAPAGTWQLEHDRRWVVVNEKSADAVLRMADHGSYLAQCSVAAEPKPAGSQPGSLSEFQDDVRRALGKHFGQFAVASESVLPSGYRWYRVVAEGRVSEVPIQWIYYKVRDPENHQAVLAFTLESSLGTRFESLDEQLVRGFRFVKPKGAK